ncbi:MAG: MaoC family dehydratase N-terminal domain-containing protein [Myxococcota bacterium]
MADGFPFPVDLTSIMLFASAVGETNRIYYDEKYAKGTALGGVIAPPTFSIASAHWNPNYFLRGVRQIPERVSERAAAKASGEERKSGEETKEGGGGANLTRVLHGEQRFEYHQPVRPGMLLTATTRPGKSWEKQGRRGGKMQFSESITEYRDDAGELIVTETSVGIVTGQVVGG